MPRDSNSRDLGVSVAGAPVDNIYLKFKNKSADRKELDKKRFHFVVIFASSDVGIVNKMFRSEQNK